MNAAPRRVRVDYTRINAVALANAETVVSALLPDGHNEGAEWVARNPRRNDRRPGSFKINLVNGRWADWATDDRGGDLISLVAYLAGVSQGEAAIKLAESLGMDLDEADDWSPDRRGSHGG